MLIFVQRTVGYEPLIKATTHLLARPASANETIGLMLAIALERHEAVSFFLSMTAAASTSEDQSPDHALVNAVVYEYQWLLACPIQNPGAIRAMFALRTDAKQQPGISYCVLKTLERLASSSHVNQASLNQCGLIQTIFDELHPFDQPNAVNGSSRSVPPHESAAPRISPETAILKRLLRRLLEMGASLDEARHMFEAVLSPHQEIASGTLEVLKAAMRAKWPEFFAMHGQASFLLADVNVPTKGFPPPTGFTFTASAYHCHLLTRFLNLEFSLCPVGLDLHREDAKERATFATLWRTVLRSV